MTMAEKTTERVTREELLEAYTNVLGEGEETARSAVPSTAVIAGAVALAVVALAYMAGRRRGRKRSAVVEIRRL